MPTMQAIVKIAPYGGGLSIVGVYDESRDDTLERVKQLEQSARAHMEASSFGVISTEVHLKESSC